MTPHWAFNSVFYHIYPLGLCGAPAANDFTAPVTPRLEQIHPWIEHLTGLGVNALYLGPLFESTSHGYDTADYYHVDRRLGTRETLARLVSALHEQGIRVILDGVFNHVGRDFWAFQDLRRHGPSSPYRDWFMGISFSGRSPYNDPFTYEGWNGHYSLVKLNLHNPAVKEHLFQAVAMWVQEFDIDGLRLDAADCVDMGFLKELSAFCRSLKPDFWTLGEIIHGDYRRWANPEMLDSVTNYECYKGLYSSHNDKNYFEIAYALERQFGSHGLYTGLPLYAFADNHDVDRVASSLQDPAHLYPLYCLLFSMPGVPSIYYGSEWGLTGKKHNGSDHALRPHLRLDQVAQAAPHPDLAPVIARLARIRRASPALRLGTYHQLHVSAQQLAFARQAPTQTVIVAVNASAEPAALALPLPFGQNSHWVDLLNQDDGFTAELGSLNLQVPAHWGRILAARADHF